LTWPDDIRERWTTRKADSNLIGEYEPEAVCFS
jgi:hypothetical protein